MTNFFAIDEINELVLQGHSYISSIGVKIIDDKNYKSSSILEGHFYEFLELLEVIELYKDIETTDDQLQQLVLRLYGVVENECLYYNGMYVDIEEANNSSTSNVGTLIPFVRLKIPSGTAIPYHIIMNTIYARYGSEPTFITQIPKPGDMTGLALRTVVDIPIDCNYLDSLFTILQSIDINLQDTAGLGYSITDTYLTIKI